MRLKLKSRVDTEGNLHLQVPKYLANQELEVIITYPSHSHEISHPTPEDLGYPEDFFEKTIGKWEGEPLIRGTQDKCDQRQWDLL